MATGAGPLAAEIAQETPAARTALPARRHRLKDGRITDVDVLRNPMDFRGRPAILAVLIDVTERTRLETELRQAQKMEAVGRLAGGIAHDFNNLVTVIDGRCDLLLGRVPTQDPARRDLNIIRGSARRASALTSQLLAFSRKQVLQPRRLDLNAVLGDMTSMLRRLVGEDMELTTEPGPGLWSVVADRTQVEQVLLNLVVNARDAMPHGGRVSIATANVELDEVIVSGDFAAQPGRYVTLKVTDSGHGMDEAVRTRVFEPFFTTKPPGRGTGLGLATVFGIVTQSAGAIAVTSAPGAGAVFTVYLPARADADPTLPETSARRAPVPGTETILLVEDEPEVRSLAREVLERHGYTVLEAATRDAIRHWAHGIGDRNAVWVERRLAPPTILFALDRVVSGYVGGLPGIHAMYAGTDFRWRRSLREGERLVGHSILLDLEEKASTFARRAIKQTYRTTFVDETGAVAAEGDSWCFRTERDTARERAK